jgi:hypothetical protein
MLLNLVNLLPENPFFVAYGAIVALGAGFVRGFTGAYRLVRAITRSREHRGKTCINRLRSSCWAKGFMGMGKELLFPLT